MSENPKTPRKLPLNALEVHALAGAAAAIDRAHAEADLAQRSLRQVQAEMARQLSALLVKKGEAAEDAGDPWRIETAGEEVLLVEVLDAAPGKPLTKPPAPA